MEAAHSFSDKLCGEISQAEARNALEEIAGNAMVQELLDLEIMRLAIDAWPSGGLKELFQTTMFRNAWSTHSSPASSSHRMPARARLRPFCNDQPSQSARLAAGTFARTFAARPLAWTSARAAPGTPGRAAAISRATALPLRYPVHGPRLLDRGARADRIPLLQQLAESRANALRDRFLHFPGQVLEGGIAVDALQVAEHVVGQAL
jgi:hypothetical protein